MSGVFAAFWLLGLLAAAPVLRGRADGAIGYNYGIADRLRDALILGIAIPFALGLVHALYPAACWIALAACIALASYRRANPSRPTAENAIPADASSLRSHSETSAAQPVPYILIVALALVAWPQLMRPILDGDSLSYHLPMAAAWVHAHALWNADPRYWWYPPASELFAAGLYAISGPFATAWSGLGALALVGFRLAQWARTQFAAPPLLADALAAATVTMLPLALQAGTLQNDVWLAAFVLEGLWAAQFEAAAALRTIVVTALLKPYGWIFAFGTAWATKLPLRVWLAAAGALALWVLHDALLWKLAVTPPAETSYGNTFTSNIITHGLPALGLLIRVTLAASPFALLALFAAAIGTFIVRDDFRPFARVATGALLYFLVMPTAYANANPQLATGASLRYAAPVFVLGALLLARPAARFATVSTVLLVLSALFGIAKVLAIYWNDAPTRSALGVAALCVVLVVSARALRSPWPVAGGLAAAIVAGCFLAARQPVAYYADALQVGGRRSGVYAWLAQNQPAAVGSWGMRLGSLNVLVPQARAVDLPDTAACATARAQGVLLVAVAEVERKDEFNARRLAAARACGRVRYDDGISVVSGD